MTHSATASPATPRQSGLRQRHEMLETRLAELRAHPSADDLEVKGLKLEKLRIKEAMAGLR